MRSKRLDAAWINSSGVGLLLALATLSWSSAAHAQFTAPNAAETNFITWMNSVASDTTDFTVAQGTAQGFVCGGAFTMYLGSCFGNNSVTPYILTAPPPSSVVGNGGLPAYFTSYFNVSPNPSTNPMYEFYQLDNDEAIVTIITLPPIAAYYSFQTYMFERQNTTSFAQQPPGGYPASSCTPGMNYPMVTSPYKLSYDCLFEEFGYFGNTVNNIDVRSQSSGALEFNTDPNNPTEAIAIITTPNDKVFTDLQAKFTSTPGLSISELFDDKMPSVSPGSGQPAVLNTGVASTSDVFTSIIRYTLPQNGNTGHIWSSGTGPQSNVLTFRVLDKNVNPTLNTKGYTSSGLLSQTANTNEVAGVTGTTCPTPSPMLMHQSLFCDIQELGHLLYVYQGSPADYSFASTASATYFPGSGTTGTGPNCIATGLPCAGAAPDTSSYDNQSIGVLNPAQPAFVIGVDRASNANDSSNPINNADYIGLSTALLAGNQGITDSLDLNSPQTFAVSSVTQYASSGTPPPLSNYLYGSGYTVVQLLVQGTGVAPSPALVADENNLFVAVINRISDSGVCVDSTSFVCSATTSYPFITNVSGAGNYPIIADGASILLTGRSYMLPASSTPIPAATGANPTETQPPYVLWYNTACAPTTPPPPASCL